MKRAFFAVTLSLAFAGAAFSIDFGIIFNAAGESAPDTERQVFAFTQSAAPWFSAVLGGKTNIHLSGKLVYGYRHNKDEGAWSPLVELERTELNFRPVQAVYLTLGRQWFTDPGKMIASGLFDGFYGRFGLGRARLSLGAFYTGFLYKKTAEIVMTKGDSDFYRRPLDYGDLTSYFASRRALASITGEFPDLTSRTFLVVSALAQFDLNEYAEDSALHSQYLEARFGVEAADTLRFFITGVGGASEIEWAEPLFNFAAALEADWEIPGQPPDMFSAELRWGSGVVNKTVSSFIPVSGIAQGTVFSPTLPGLMNGRLSYTVRPSSAFSFSAAALVFLRTDLETFKDPELDFVSKDRFLGEEFYGQVVWAPQLPIRMTAGAGFFLPGGAFIKDAGPRWKVSAGFVLSL
jgi:hypothetical protein